MSVCGRKKGNFKRCQSAVTESESSMHFWGICCESGKLYNQVVGQRFRVTMAVLDPTSFQNDASERIVSLIVLRDGIEYLLCVLKHDEIHQVSLNLVFDKGENVRFYIKGHGNVYLSGYQLTGSEEDILNDENGYLCPLVEVKTKNKKKKASISRELSNDDIEMNLEKGKRKSKPGKASLAGSSLSPSWSTLLAQSQEEDDESDEDFTPSDEEFKSDEDTSDEEDIEDEEELVENELDNDSSEEDEKEVVLNSRGSQKRRKQEKVLPVKRSKKNSSNNSSNSVTEDVICIDDEDGDSEYGSDSGDKDTSTGLKSSFGSPSQSKMQANMEVASNEKKSKKKKKRDKKLNDISAISGTSANSQNQFPKLKFPVDESTPKLGPKPGEKLKGGLVVQDLTVGRGPVANQGKTVHVFYVGRFPDKKIFDSRVPGAGKKPFSFKLGAGQVIKGWDLGLVGMRVGGKRKIKVPPKMGYGSQQHPDIPPDSTLYFIVELVAVS